MCRHMVHACLGTLARLNEEDKKRRLIYANDVDEDPILVVRLCPDYNLKSISNLVIRVEILMVHREEGLGLL